jgi:hypothetical protein
MQTVDPPAPASNHTGRAAVVNTVTGDTITGNTVTDLHRSTIRSSQAGSSPGSFFMKLISQPWTTLGRRGSLTAICSLYLVLAGIFATTTFDMDEFNFVREPYEMLGGDYTKGYLQKHQFGNALDTLARAYYFYWNYRPLNAPVVREDHRFMFQQEEKEFGYFPAPTVGGDDPAAVEKYQRRLVVPEPDRFFKHGAGKPLLPAILSIPQSALFSLAFDKERLLKAQFHQFYDPLFIILRLAQLLAGLASIILVFKILERTVDLERAYLGALIFAVFPITIKYFPNLHHDSILVPFVLLTVYLHLTKRYVSAGVAYGLALASKNLAVIVLPALTADIAIQAYRIWREVNSAVAMAFLRTQLARMAVFGTVAFATLLPFANPVSYAEEVLTPVISRPTDPRGENIGQWSVDSMLSGKSALSPQVAFARKFLYFKDIGFLFFILALFLAIRQQLPRAARLSLILVATYLPMSAIFGVDLEYRTLLIIPLFAIIAAELIQPVHLRWLAGIAAALALIYVSNPARTDAYHIQHIGQGKELAGRAAN